MSIFATVLSLNHDEHEDGCAVWLETSPGCFEDSGKDCDCGLPRCPIVYEGSHVLPSNDDRRGGDLDVALIPAHIEREGREDGREGVMKDWLRLTVGNVDSTLQYEGAPYVSAGRAAVILDRSNVEELRDTLTYWLERDEASL